MIRWERSLATAAIALTVACLAFGYTFVRAVVIESTRPIESKPAVSEKGAVDPPARAQARTAVRAPVAERPNKAATQEMLSQSDLMLAVEHDPFQADRQRVAERYRMPGEEEVVEEPPPPPPPPPPFRVLGTIVTPQGGVAVIETQSSGSRVVGVGEALFGFTLTSVNPAIATVEGNGGRLYSLQVEEPVMRRPGRGNAARGGRGPQPADNMRQLIDNQAQLVEELLRGRGGAADPRMLEQAMDALRRNMPNLGRGMQSVEVVRGANGQQQFIIRPRPDTSMTPEATPRRPNR